MIDQSVRRWRFPGAAIARAFLLAQGALVAVFAVVYIFIALTTNADHADGGGTQGFSGVTVVGSALLGLVAAVVAVACLVGGARWSCQSERSVLGAGAAQAAIAAWLFWAERNLDAGTGYSVGEGVWFVALVISAGAAMPVGSRILTMRWRADRGHGPA